MLSDAIREMRREFQNALMEAGEAVQISVSNMQTFIIALSVYEDQAREMEAFLWPQPVALPHSKNEKNFVSPHLQELPKLTVIQGGVSADQ